MLFQAIKNIWFANNPEKERLPLTDSNGEGLSSMEKLLVFITIRPDKLIPAVRYVQQMNVLSLLYACHYMTKTSKKFAACFKIDLCL